MGNVRMEPGFETREKDSLGIASAAFVKAATPAVAFGGGKESIVLMHLVRRLASGRLLPVLFVKPGPEQSRLFYFVEKMRRLWGLRLVMVERAEIQDPGVPICAVVHEEVSGLLRYASQRHGITHLFMGLRRCEKGVGENVAGVMECGGVTLVNPLADFSEDDVWEYIRRHNLPVCSLYKGSRGKLGCLSSKPGYAPPMLPVYDGTGEEADIRERLKSLGYL